MKPLSKSDNLLLAGRMRRWQLFEFGDQPWLPTAAREMLGEMLQMQLAEGQMYAPAAGILLDLLQETGHQRIIDCGSGLGGPWSYLYPQLQKAGRHHLQLWLTDKFPPEPEAVPLVAHFPEAVTYHRQPISAVDLPASWEGIHTFFTVFHHFDPQTAAHLLQTIASQGHALAVFEFTHRDWDHVWGMRHAPAAVRPLVQRLATNGSRRRWAAVLPYLYGWDAFVSQLRTYSAAELLEMGRRVTAANYQWESGRIPAGEAGYGITYLIGYSET